MTEATEAASGFAERLGAVADETEFDREMRTMRGLREVLATFSLHAADRIITVNASWLRERAQGQGNGQ